MNRCWVYHPSEEAKIVSDSEARILMCSGWYDSPAKFPQNLPQDNVLCETPPEKKRRRVKPEPEVNSDNSS